MQGDRWRLGHRPGLDGVRGLAIVLVLVSHSYVPGVRGAGQVGVTLFFVLSGFLITRLLVEERRDRGRVSLASFYERRALRLLPALFVLVVVLLLLGDVGWSQVWPVLAYVGNYARMAGTDLGSLNHTWSLAVEEQFYVVWPLLLVWAGRRWALAVAVFGIVWPLFSRHGADHLTTIVATDLRAQGILAGCLLALFMHRLDGRSPRGLGWPAVASLAAGCTLWDPLGWGAVHNLAAVGGTAAVWIAVQRPPSWLTWRPLSEIGRVSYGLYLWHRPIFDHVEMDTRLVESVVELTASALVTWLSWRLVEAPALRLRGRLVAHAAAARGTLRAAR